MKMKVRDVQTGDVFRVKDIKYLFTHPSATTLYILEDDREFTNGEFWSRFTQVPEMEASEE